MLNQLLYGAEGDEVAEIVEAITLIVARGNEFEAVPVVQLFWRQTQDALDFGAAESVRGSHEKFSVLLFLADGFLPLLRNGHRTGCCRGFHRARRRLLGRGLPLGEALL